MEHHRAGYEPVRYQSAGFVLGHFIDELTPAHRLHDEPSPATQARGRARIEPFRLEHRFHPLRVIRPVEEREHLLRRPIDDDALFNLNGVWLPNQPVAEEETAWVRTLFAALAHHQRGAYVNFLHRDDEARVRSAYGEDKYRRLAALQQRYDPENVFRLNHNIKPSGSEKLVAGTTSK